MPNELNVWNPSDEIQRMRRMMNRIMGSSLEPLMGEGLGPRAFGVMEFAPAIEIEDLGNEFLVRTELPGVSEKDVQLTVSGNTLTVRGEKRYRRTIGEGERTEAKGGRQQGESKGRAVEARGNGEQEEGMAERPMFTERVYGRFERVVTLPADVQTENIDANFRDGVLEVRIPRREESRPRQIPVKVH